ncbi:MAG: EAL domain-containing protein [Acidovorax sp.]|nr:EAL domain-containing protein [Acidovorax sp.]
MTSVPLTEPTPQGAAGPPAEAAQRLQALLEMLPLAVLEFRLEDGVLALVSANAAARSTAVLREALDMGARVDEVFSVLAGTALSKLLHDAVRTGRPMPAFTHAVPSTDAQGPALAWEISARRSAPGLLAVVVRDIADTVALDGARQELREQVHVLHAMESLAQMGHWRRGPSDPDGFTAWSPGLRQIAGLGDEEPMVSYELGRSGILPEDLPAFVAARERPEGVQLQYRWRRPDGEVRWMLSHVRKPSEHDSVQMELGVVRDITDERRVAERLRDRLDFIERIASRIPGYIYQYRIHPDGLAEVPYISEAVRDLMGVEPAQAMRDYTVMTQRVLPEDQVRLRRFTGAALREMQPWQCEYRVRLPDGTLRWHMASVVPHREPDGSVLSHGFTMDITDRKRAEQEIERLAFYDALTGLPNRRLLLDRLQRAVASCLRNRQRGALLFIDLDNFKDLNDTLGHDMGDQLLSEVAQRLVAAVRETDTVARFGGDEFVVMLESLAPDPAEAALQAETVADKLLAHVNQPIALGGQQHYSSPSIGIALFGDQRVGVDELLKRADLAMYQAKAAGRNTLRFFDPGMQAAVNARLHLEADLRQGLARGEFTVHYQPVVDHRARLVGAEALVRWLHPVRGMVSPGDFIPLAEQTGFILPLGHFVLRAACEQLVRWAQSPGTEHLCLSVNVSARQFRQPGFVAEVLDTLRACGANPRRLTLELTESLLLGDIEDTIARMGQLKKQGVGFALDDFGTGYSSLSYLKRLPLDQIKIDQSFVRDVLADPNDAAIVRTILALAKSLDLQVVAEGVETAGQLGFLRLHGCDGFQGYLFGRPAPVEAWDELLYTAR